MVGIESIAVTVSVIVVVSLAVWGLYTLVKITGMAKEVCSNELPYKVEPAEQLAISGDPIPLRLAVFEEEKKPKRKYTKRKPAAKKKITQKKTSKSK